MTLTNLLWIPQVEEVQVALVAHLFVCGEHDDVAAEVEATRPDSRVGLEQGQLFTYEARGGYSYRGIVQVGAQTTAVIVSHILTVKSS